MRARLLSAPTLAGLALLLLAGLLYAFTIDTGLHPAELEGGDLITHQYAQVQARPGNAPGYPLYTMGGWLWFHGLRSAARLLGSASPNPLPILSSYSTLWALAALGLLDWLIRFVTSSRYRPGARWGRAGNWPLAWLIVAFYAVTYFFWYYATTTEQYSSAVAQTLAILCVYLLWAEADAESANRQPAARTALHSRAGRLLLLLAFLCGLSLAHMLTVAFIVPPLVIAILRQRPALLRQGRLVTATVAAALLPLAAYLYVYVRGAQHPEWWGSVPYADARAWFWAFVSTGQGRQELGWGFEPGAAFLGNGFPELIWGELSLPILLAGLAGIALLRKRTAFVLYGTLVIYLLFCWAYRYGNWFQVILPAYPLVLLGLGALVDRIQAWPRAAASPWLRAAPLLLLIVAIGWRFTLSLPRADSRHRADDRALDRAALLLAGELPRDAALFAAHADAAALDYLAQIWGLRPDVALVGSDQVAGLPAQGRPLLATWEAAPTLLAEMGTPQPHVAAWNADWALVGNAQSAASPPPLPEMDERTLLMDAGQPVLVLDAYRVAPAPTGAPVTAAAPALDVWLAWRLPQGRWPEGVALSLRPIRDGAFLPAPDGPPEAIVQVDAAAPLRGLLDHAAEPTAFVDAYRLPLPAPLPDGADGLALLLYRTGADGGFETLADVRLPLEP